MHARRRIKSAILLMVLAAGLLFHTGCDATRATIHNATEMPLTVHLVAADGSRVALFEAIPPGEEAAFQVLPFETYSDVLVELVHGDANEGLVDLTIGIDNRVTVYPADQPAVAP